MITSISCSSIQKITKKAIALRKSAPDKLTQYIPKDIDKAIWLSLAKATEA